MDEITTLRAEKDAAIREMHSRELHHFEEEQRSASLEAALDDRDARIEAARKELGGYILQETQDGGSPDPAVVRADDVLAGLHDTDGGSCWCGPRVVDVPSAVPVPQDNPEPRGTRSRREIQERHGEWDKSRGVYADGAPPDEAFAEWEAQDNPEATREMGGGE
ncbi:hypothetical protein [Microbacterium sp. BR1]|uniref:hypothetical protein n=1 Tax=Microbacterium sp. BR1 TaxID=1070896 RepID=UPI0012FD4B5C|nr:hypothetical protein [Microbacterium sp. BR1]